MSRDSGGPEPVDLGRPQDAVLFHLAEPSEWAASDDQYRAGSLETEGFLHLSAGHQVIATTERHYAGRSGLLLLTIDRAALDDDLVVWEEAPHGEAYPHLYGPLPLTAVTEVRPWPPT